MKASSSLISSAISGLIASSYAFSKTGAMMKAVRNIANEMITVFGGDCWMPMAVRSRESTITIRVKEVTMIKIEGAILRMVTSAMICSARSVTPVPSPRPMEMSWAKADGAKIEIKTQLKIMMNVLLARQAHSLMNLLLFWVLSSSIGDWSLLRINFSVIMLVA